ncbi:MFS transporter [Baekduia soli]|uniref:MFS transporter n=1 Tax=Baekduia soli TaxID=496014 RepID=A0A5B8U809_9ACTN|nr:MFS transporter [Baekduia soli]QEC49204.1 MFS transporter [Baekduia soli]
MLQASIMVTFLASSAAPAPLYSIWQAEWGFSAISITVIFAAYGIALLAALLTVGSLSDYIGRQRVLVVAVAGQAVAMVVFARAGDVPVLLGARVLQGLCTGGALGAAGAGLLDIDKPRGTVANAVYPPMGTAGGALGAGLLIAHLPSPTHLVFWILAAILAIQTAGVLLMAESVGRMPGALASLRPGFSLPPATRPAMLVAVPALVATWTMAGFYGSVGPSLVHLVADSRSPVLGALPLTLFAGFGAVSVAALRTTAAEKVMVSAAAALLLGVGLTFAGLEVRSVVLILAGVAVGGIGYGAGFHGVVNAVAPLAAPHERAGVIAVIYLVAYLAMSLPAVLAGVLVVHDGLLPTARGFAIGLLVLGSLALAGMVWWRGRQAAAADAVQSRP